MASTSPVMDAFFKSEEMEGKVSDEDLPKFTESWDAWDGAASSLAPSHRNLRVILIFFPVYISLLFLII